MNSLQPTWIVLAVLSSLLAATLGPEALGQTPAAAQVEWGGEILRQPLKWYSSAAARTAADSVMMYQAAGGGWPKNTDLLTPPSTSDNLGHPTIDNGATTTPMRFLALVGDATGEVKYGQAFERGMDYLFAAQYPNGGWPQFYPLRDGYYSRITYNDNAMANVLTLMRSVGSGTEPYGFVDQERRDQAAAALERGIDVILRSQVR